MSNTTEREAAAVAAILQSRLGSSRDHSGLNQHEKALWDRCQRLMDAATPAQPVAPAERKSLADVWGVLDDAGEHPFHRVTHAKRIIEAALAASQPVAPLPPIVKVLAEWEDRNGSLAGILPSEWSGLWRDMTTAAVEQSPRQLRAALAASQPVAPAVLDVLKEVVAFWDSITAEDCVNDIHVRARAALAASQLTPAIKYADNIITKLPPGWLLSVDEFEGRTFLSVMGPDGRGALFESLPHHIELLHRLLKAFHEASINEPKDNP